MKRGAPHASKTLALAPRYTSDSGASVRQGGRGVTDWAPCLLGQALGDRVFSSLGLSGMCLAAKPLSSALL